VPTAIFTLSLHDALPIFRLYRRHGVHLDDCRLEETRRGPSGPSFHELSSTCIAGPKQVAMRYRSWRGGMEVNHGGQAFSCRDGRSEEHTSELQSPDHLVC